VCVFGESSRATNVHPQPTTRKADRARWKAVSFRAAWSRSSMPVQTDRLLREDFAVAQFLECASRANHPVSLTGRPHRRLALQLFSRSVIEPRPVRRRLVDDPREPPRAPFCRVRALLTIKQVGASRSDRPIFARLTMIRFSLLRHELSASRDRDQRQASGAWLFTPSSARDARDPYSSTAWSRVRRSASPPPRLGRDMPHPGLEPARGQQ
jgi:hypothetical protein